MSSWVRPAAAAVLPGGDPVRTNYAKNGHPLSSLTGQWSAQGATGATTGLDFSTALAADGRAGVARMTRTGTPTGGEQQLRYQEHDGLPAEVEPGSPYVVSAYVKATTNTFATIVRHFAFEGFWFEEAGASVQLIANTWARVSWSTADTASANGATHLGVGVKQSGFAPGLWSDLQASCVMIEAGPELAPYFDGGSPATPPYSYRWQAGAGISVSHAVLTRYVGELEVPLILEYSGNVDTRHSTLEVLGRRDPIPVLGPGGLRSGTMDLFGFTHEQCRSWEALFSAGVVGVRDTEYPGLAMLCVATRTTVAPVPEKIRLRPWVLTVEFTEVLA